MAHWGALPCTECAEILPFNILVGSTTDRVTMTDEATAHQQHAQLAEGIARRFTEITRTIDRRDAIVWQVEADHPAAIDESHDP